MKCLEVFVLCVMCMRIWFWDVSSSPSGCAGSWFVLGFVSLFCVGPYFCVRCSVFRACRSFCVFVFWCLVMSSPVGARSPVVVIGSVSYLIFSDKMSSRVLVVCLSGVCCVFSSFSFYVDRVK